MHQGRDLKYTAYQNGPCWLVLVKFCCFTTKYLTKTNINIVTVVFFFLLNDTVRRVDLWQGKMISYDCWIDQQFLHAHGHKANTPSTPGDKRHTSNIRNSRKLAKDTKRKGGKAMEKRVKI